MLIYKSPFIAILGCNKSQSLSSLYDFVTQTDETFLFCSAVTYDMISRTKLGQNGVGLVVNEDINNQLRPGDRFLTINDKNIFNITHEEWNTIKITVAFPVEAVVMRQKIKFPPSTPGEKSICRVGDRTTEIEMLTVK